MIQVSSLYKAYGEQILFDGGSFVLNSRERVGLVGRNGSGKSTLLKLIVDEEHPDKGSITFPKGYKIGRLKQHLTFTEKTILEEACLGLPDDERDQTYRGEILLAGLGFSEEDFQRAPSEFSGGYQIRINLAKLLLSEPNLLLLDEPTNYLDIVSMRWLEGALRSWKGELILITHDRAFMDSVTTHTMLIYRSGFKKIAGSTQKLFDTIALDEEVYEKTRVNEEKKRKDMEQFINRFRAKASKATLVQSRVKALEKLSVKEELTEEDTLEFSFASKVFHGRTLLEVRNLSFGYDPAHPLVQGLTFSVSKNDRIGVIGKNGRGKSTLLRLLAGELKPQKGEAIQSTNTALAYFGQTNIDRLSPKLTVEDEITSAHPEMSRTRVRGICGTMMFEGDAALKKIQVLSGGERSRVLLGKIIATPSNLLLLDEPTNHLDMDSVESLKEAILNYSGGVLLVTHNEMLLKDLCTKLIVFQGGAPFFVEGGYDYFLEKFGWEEEQTSSQSAKPTASITKKSNASSDSKTLKQIDQAIAKIEEKIVKLEEKQKVLENEMQVAFEQSDNAKIQKLSSDLFEIGEKVEALFSDLETKSKDKSSL